MLCFSFSHSRHDAVEPEGAQGSDSMARELEGGAGSTRSDASPPQAASPSSSGAAAMEEGRAGRADLQRSPAPDPPAPTAEEGVEEAGSRVPVVLAHAKGGWREGEEAPQGAPREWRDGEEKGGRHTT
jgi:hypothetical protein